MKKSKMKRCAASCDGQDCKAERWADSFFMKYQITSKNKESIEPEFLNFYGAQESVPRNQFCQPLKTGGPVRQPYPTRFLPSPIDCL